MITGNRDYNAGGGFEGLLEGLEQLACRLDAEKFPGKAWPVPAAPRSRPFLRKIVAPLALAAAAASACAVLALRGPEPPIQPTQPIEQANIQTPQSAEELAAGARVVAQAAIPQVVVVEDMESYSFIDMTSRTPMVSFATKDSCIPACVVPVANEPAPESGDTGNGT